MKRKGRLGVFGSICLVSALAISSILLVYVSLASAADEAYPSKPIRLIIGGKAGDAYDINGRRFAPTLAKKWGVNVMPVNHEGPMSADFFDAVHEATPDGYTLGFGGAAHRLYHIIKTGRLKYDVTSMPVVGGNEHVPGCGLGLHEIETELQDGQ